jgi:hypothetical protein
VKSSLLKGIVVAVVLAAVLVPAAAAKPHHSALKLSLVPLPKARLGVAAVGLKLSTYSGPYQNGRSQSGYQLAYGSPFLANPGLDYAETAVWEYKTARAAKHDLTKLKKDAFRSLATSAGLFSHLNLTFTAAPLSVPGIGRSHWAVIETFSVANHGSVYVVGVDFRDGKYILESAAAAGSQALATSYAAAKARLLDKRLHLGLKGRLHGHPVALPKHSKPGPPASGTDPATAVLQTSDLPGSQIKDQGYRSAEAALSSYDVSFQPAGTFDAVDQTVSLMPSANSAAFAAALQGATLVGFFSTLAGGTVTPVDLSAVGDDAQAAIVSISGAGATNLAVVTLDSGPVADVLVVKSGSTIDPTAVQTLAQAAATRLDAAVGP